MRGNRIKQLQLKSMQLAPDPTKAKISSAKWLCKHQYLSLYISKVSLRTCQLEAYYLAPF
jgi:hypothetical protein